MARLAPAIALLTAFACPVQAENYLCIGDLSTGFFWNGSEWQQTYFNVKADQFVVAIDGLTVTVTRVGRSAPTHTCELAVAGIEQAACGGLGYGFVVNFRTLRFQDYYGLGYVNGGDSADNTPSLTIGRCSPF